jgi:hypothetical protein
VSIQARRSSIVETSWVALAIQNRWDMASAVSSGATASSKIGAGRGMEDPEMGGRLTGWARV